MSANQNERCITGTCYPVAHGILLCIFEKADVGLGQVVKAVCQCVHFVFGRIYDGMSILYKNNAADIKGFIAIIWTRSLPAIY